MTMAKELTSTEIIRSLEKQKKELDKYSVKKIGLFGSFLDGSASKDSDIDFLVSFKKNSFDNYMDLKFSLQNLFGKKIDLVTESALKPALRHIKNEALYARI